MKLRDLPLSLAQTFGNDNVSFTNFVQPRQNPLLGAQFVNKNGRETHCTSDDNSGVYFDEPLSGPFYDLPLVGFALSDQKHGLLHQEKGLIAFAEKKWEDGIAKGKIGIIGSAVFFVKVPIRELEKYAQDHGIAWFYYCGLSSRVKFDDLSGYIRHLKELVVSPESCGV